MRALIQRVEEASVDVVTDGGREHVGAIGTGLCVLVGVTHGDTEQDAQSVVLQPLGGQPQSNSAGDLSLCSRTT